MAHPTEVETASVPDVAGGTALRFLAVHLDLGTLKPLSSGLTSPVETALVEELVRIARRPSSGIVSVCYAARGPRHQMAPGDATVRPTPTWADLGPDADFLDRRGLLIKTVRPLASAAIRDRRDSPGDGTTPVRDDERGKLWLRVLFDKDLDSAIKRCNKYESFIKNIQLKRFPLSDTPPHTQPELIDARLATVPEKSAYDAVAEGLEAETRTFRRGVADRLLHALKEEMRRRDHGTYDQKVELVRWVKSELRRFDMACRHPKTGEAATLNASPGNDHDIGSFELAGKDADGTRRTFTTPDLETLLSKLELMDAPARREALAEWQEKVGRDRRGAKRG